MLFQPHPRRSTVYLTTKFHTLDVTSHMSFVVIQTQEGWRRARMENVEVQDVISSLVRAERLRWLWKNGDEFGDASLETTDQ